MYLHWSRSCEILQIGHKITRNFLPPLSQGTLDAVLDFGFSDVRPGTRRPFPIHKQGLKYGVFIGTEHYEIVPSNYTVESCRQICTVKLYHHISHLTANMTGNASERRDASNNLFVYAPELRRACSPENSSSGYVIHLSGNKLSEYGPSQPLR